MGTSIIDELLNDDGESNDQADMVDVTVTTEPIRATDLPSRVGPMAKLALTTTFQRLYGPDLKRKRTNLICDTDWEISRSGATGSGVPWYAKVPLVVEHADTVWARVPTSTGTLSILPEYWAA